MSKPNVLFVSHKEKQCGVYQFGYNIGRALKRSKKYNFIYVECSSFKDLDRCVRKFEPVCTIYNHHGATQRWLTSRITEDYKTPQIGIIHEITQKVSDSATDYFFDAYIAPDPTLILKNPIVYKTGRLLLKNNLKPKINKIPVIGSFGFASPNKNFDLLVREVCHEFDKVIIRLNIPYAKFGDENGYSARKVISECLETVKKYPKIKLEYSHDFLDEKGLLNFLNSNTLNAFLYSDKGNRGVSSVIDSALSVNVPIAISGNSTMFRHIENAYPSIVYSKKNKFKNIIENRTEPLKEFCSEWTEENLVWDYERIVTDVLAKIGNKKGHGFYARSIMRFLKRIMFGNPAPVAGDWPSNVSDYKDNAIEYRKDVNFKLLKISKAKLTYNRILDNKARLTYDPAINTLFKIIPKWMNRKNKMANVQQAFVFDTVARLCKGKENTKILSVGCFEDTAFGALKTLGYKIIGIDPVVNYDLDTYITKPSIRASRFDIVFSTSVIEHVEDDLNFLKNMQKLTKGGGYIVLTCDFKEGFTDGDPKPGCNFRFYTKERLLNLISNLHDCKLVGDVKWDCPNPDFDWGMGSNKYTFASVVLQKK